METTNTLITQIKKMALPGEVQQITGTSLLVKNLFCSCAIRATAQSI